MAGGQVGGHLRFGRRRVSPGVVDEEAERVSGKAFDVFCRGERDFFFRRRVTVQTWETEAFVQHSERRLIAVARLGHRGIAGPQSAPEPSVLRRFRILDHHRPRSGIELLSFVTGGGRGRVHFFYDHRAVGNAVDAAVDQPLHYRGRIVDSHCRVSAEVFRVDVGSGVAHAFVDAPAELDVFGALKEGEELIVKIIGSHRAWKRQRIFLCVGALRDAGGRRRGLI